MIRKASLLSPLFVVGVCFFLSGMAALLYQTAWMRQLSVVFGTSELAVATVLTAYMSGLSLGALLAGRYINRISRPLLTYGILEGGIAVAAIAVPFLLKFADTLAIIFLGGQETPPEAAGVGQLLFFYLTTLVVLILPTAFMGATLPLLSKYVVDNDQQVGTRIGGLYAINTAGAIFGTLVAGFVLLPNITLMQTIWAGALLNIIVLYLVVKLVKKLGSKAVQTDTSSSKSNPNITAQKTSRFALILPVMTFSGVATFIYEVLWTRLLSHVLGGSVAAFSVMLAAFLTGIALGSAIAARYASDRSTSIKYFVGCQLAIAASVAGTFYYLNTIDIQSTGLYGNSALAFIILLPSTLFIGATFPFAVRIFAKDEHDAPAASGRVYAYNTLGAILGATLAGFFLIPALKYEGAVVVGVLINLVLALLMYASSQAKIFGLKSFGSLSMLVLVMLVAAFYRPSAPFKLITQSPLSGDKVDEANIEFYDVGRSSTVLLADLPSYFRLRNNGLPESAIAKKGLPRSPSTASLLAILPVAARPDAKTMLVAGFGGGVVVEHVPPTIKEIDVMELEPKVIAANQLISEQRQTDPLKDSRVNIIYNDARGALKLTDKLYDVVVSQPSHPWTAGASHLYTKEYMELVKRNLSKDGVFLQWMNISFTDEYLLRSLSKTLIETFKEVKIYSYSPGVLYFLASEKPIEIEKMLLESGRPISDAPDFYSYTELNSLEGIMSGLFMETEQVRKFSELGELITDNFNLFGTRSALALENKTTLSHEVLISMFIDNSPVFKADYWAYNTDSSVKFPYLVERLAKFRSTAMLARINKNLKARNNNQLHYFQLGQLFAKGQIEAADSFVKENPSVIENHDASFLYLINKKTQAGFEGFDSHAKRLLASLPSSAQVIVNEIEIFTDRGAISQVDQNSYEALVTAELHDAWFPYSSALLSSSNAEKAYQTGNYELGQQALHEIDRVASAPVMSAFPLVVIELKLLASLSTGYTDRIIEELKRYAAFVDQSTKVYDQPDQLLTQDVYRLLDGSLERVLLLLVDFQANRLTVNELTQSKPSASAEQTSKAIDDGLNQLKQAQTKLRGFKVL